MTRPKPRLELRRCAYCTAGYQPYVGHQKFCTARCRQAHHDARSGDRHRARRQKR